MNENKIKILAISGSLRSNSSNTALVRAIANLSPKNIDFTIYNGLGDLPHFNPDIDIDDHEPPAVKDLRTQLKEADGVLICTPEYGNGVPGVLKNALDWIVSSGEFMNKPTAVISASPSPMGGDKAHASLLLTLKMIDATIVEGGTMMIPHIGLKLNKEGIITDLDTKQKLLSVLWMLEQACH
ncbi:NAD(P)H-dependent FMN reductase [Aneurinibacillus soli]|uniref:NADPH azoreductase n=1 Tax=Aneurinibacillus soli TaxID=1500254 RepID=A0A0U4WIX6_9BACL|nr:NAD(P)H-dependent oxidoreductase [Aneurinibacillus soli]PYE62272.1 NAD(P)H-dependent FMN reductase [Aneurinibacillus soli]BAU28539.1 NADPH azoreductase [Aneurinibacillus soli]